MYLSRPRFPFKLVATACNFMLAFIVAALLATTYSATSVCPKTCDIDDMQGLLTCEAHVKAGSGTCAHLTSLGCNCNGYNIFIYALVGGACRTQLRHGNFDGYCDFPLWIRRCESCTKKEEPVCPKTCNLGDGKGSLTCEAHVKAGSGTCAHLTSSGCNCNGCVHWVMNARCNRVAV